MAKCFSARRLGSLALFLSLTLCLTSCGGKGSNDPNKVTLEIKPELGDLANYMSISGSEVTFSLSESTDDGKPIVQIASNLEVTVSKDVASDLSFGLNGVVLDADMNEITDFGAFELEDKTDYAFGKFHYYLTKGSYRAVMKGSCSKEDWASDYAPLWEQIKKNGKYIVLKPQYSYMVKFVPYTGEAASASASSSDEEVVETIAVIDDDDTDSEASESSSSDEDFDEFLKAYEKYIDKYIALMKKAKSGDMSAVTEAASLMSDAQEYAEKLQKASGKLTPAQIAKFQKLQTKMIEAAQQ